MHLHSLVSVVSYYNIILLLLTKCLHIRNMPARKLGRKMVIITAFSIGCWVYLTSIIIVVPFLDCSPVIMPVQALTLGLWVQWPGGPVDLKTYWPPKKLTGPYLKTKLARRKTICINLQFAHRPIIKLFRSHPRNIFQILMVIL